MKLRTGVIAAAVLGLTIAAGAQQPPATAPPPTEGHGGPPPPGAQTPPAPSQGGFPQGPPRFPAHQRPPVDPAVLERGRGVYVGACGACHGVDARGGQLGGLNLLRSQLVLNDQDGELISPVVKNGRPGTLMLPIAVADADITAIAAYLHGLQAQGTNQGGPPPGPPVELNILLGDARAGEKYFAARCGTCHSAAADLQGLATRVPDPKMLQNLWVSGGRVAGPRSGGRRPPSASSAPTATVTFPSGEKVEGRLLRLDDFLVTVAFADGTARTIRRDGEAPTVEVKDPLDGHRDLLSILPDSNMHDVTAYLATRK